MRIGVDLGGTKIEAAAFGDGRELARERLATPRGDYEATVEAVVRVVRALEAGAGRGGSVGVGMPGALSRQTGRVKNANSTWLNGRPLDRDLSDRLGRPVRVANDADCFALAEAVDGAGAGAGVVFGVILGTGVGGGIVVNGRLLGGPNGIAGEWGHNPLPWPTPAELPGPPCYCGRQGCIETWLSGPGLAADHVRHTGSTLEGSAIVAAAAAGDAAACRTLARYTDRLARGLASVINVLDPDVVVLGGGLSGVAQLYAEVPRRWRRYVFSDRVDTRLLAPRHGAAAGVRGAAWLWPAGEATGQV